MKMIKGIAGSPGYGRGVAVVKRAAAAPTRFVIDNPQDEEKRFRAAQNVCKQRYNCLAEASDAQAADIFKAYIAILNDKVFFEEVLKRVAAERVNVEFLIYDECAKVVAQFAAFDDPYLRERAVDIENVCNEIIGVLLGLENFAPVFSGEDVIIVAQDLTPAETVQMDKSKLRGFVTEKGGTTSHTVILAKSLGIAAIVGADGAMAAIKDGDFLLMDAFKGDVTINPDAAQLEDFNALSAAYGEKQQIFDKSATAPAVTQDGYHIDININAGDDDSIKSFDPARCDGVGLLRTEFIYMDSKDYPTEDAQFEIYSRLAKKAAGKEVIIRTLDIGGDKQLGYMDLPVEENPFLGYRAIRLCLDRRDVFNTQLRAILRASAFGNVKIMFPMIVCVEELRAAKACVEEAKTALRRENIAFDEKIPIGIMIETPAAVLVSDVLANQSDFFSVGTNDLIQYITATDRMNPRVSYLYDSCSPAVLNAMALIAKSAAGAGIPWGICGETASEDRLVPLWLALNAAELSVAPSMVGRVKYLVGRIDRAAIKSQIDAALKMTTADEIRSALDAILYQIDVG